MVICYGEFIFYLQGEKVLSGVIVVFIVGKIVSWICFEVVVDYIVGYVLVNEVSLLEESFYCLVIKVKCCDGFCLLGEMVLLSDVDNFIIIIEING